jgi:hypothetical protein
LAVLYLLGLADSLLPCFSLFFYLVFVFSNK